LGSVDLDNPHSAAIFGGAAAEATVVDRKVGEEATAPDCAAIITFSGMAIVEKAEIDHDLTATVIAAIVAPATGYLRDLGRRTNELKNKKGESKHRLSGKLMIESALN
jgi:hypothetical protein